ncbi:hypothetical protein CCE28_18690 [Anaeromicrobium sediminis]|uniref:Cupin type-2 domain-containing protein n=2 Tax=Anaeromicrobium sediminis TaxID=1478221 RepID=A0A267MDD5_9FIRM|nr:hypothetical protein CCE28_18690 [Anaeromicrobium sediminis]
MMLVEGKFEKGSGMPNCHTHEHEQITYVTKGSVEFVCDGETKILNEGDSIYVAPNLEHTVSKAFEDSIVLDIFAPQREDFLK